ncbi:MAG TPA: acyltransferase family protein [Candidatus Limnocylindrales bacterium]|nr:acyltransferase family protein [Candidatus Limnocylindrales bacterium]
MSRPREHDGFRPDIEGLRGLAVALVVLYHVGVGGFGGGFVGVDVFFVVSGFLISGLLLRERERSGRISIVDFYERRVLRILPAAAVVIVATLVVGYRLAAPLDRQSVGLDGMAAALSIGNVRFALGAGDYFSSVAAPSPFLHFWSLGVEEQFYLVWPAVLVVATAVPRGRRLVAGVILAVIVVVSFAASIVLTDSAPNWAFYSLPTRAWQLAAGGLLAVGWRWIARAPAAVRVVVGWCGLAAVIGVAGLLDDSVPYPGLASLWPTLGAVALIAGGTARTGPAVLLVRAPVRFLGRISYSLYLWHWPILVLVPTALGVEPDVVGRLGLAGLAVVVATASWALVEQPFRRGLPALHAAPARTVSAGIAAILLVTSIGGGLVAAGAVPTAASPGSGPVAAPSLAWDDGAPVVAAAPTEPSPRRSAAPAPGSAAASPTTNPSSTPLPSSTVVASSTRPQPPADEALPADVRPALASARSDEERLRADHCLAFEPQAVPNAACAYGPAHASFTVALVGDSHAAHWFPALEAIAQHRGWRLLVFTKVSCPFIDLAVWNRVLERDYRECAAFRDATIARLAIEKPDLVVVAMSRWIKPLAAADATNGIEAAAIGRAVRRLPGRVAIVVDTPYAKSDIPGCLSAHTDDVTACAFRISGGNGVLERAAAKASGAAVVDLTASLCVRGLCPAVANGMIVYRDSHHLTATFSRSLGPVLDRALRRVLAG